MTKRNETLDDVLRHNIQRADRWLNELRHAFAVGDYDKVKYYAWYLKRRAIAMEDDVDDFKEELK